MSETVEDILAEFREAFLQGHAEQWDAWIARNCESPIEKLFMAAMLGSGFEAPSIDIWHDIVHAKLDGHDSERGMFVDEGGTVCIPQFTINGPDKKYRVDFAFLEPAWSTVKCRVAVELDGHQFHERTKQQATADKRRDRQLQALGWRVLRFTGSEVWADPSDCVEQVRRFIFDICR